MNSLTWLEKQLDHDNFNQILIRSNHHNLNHNHHNLQSNLNQILQPGIPRHATSHGAEPAEPLCTQAGFPPGFPHRFPRGSPGARLRKDQVAVATEVLQDGHHLAPWNVDQSIVSGAMVDPWSWVMIQDHGWLTVNTSTSDDV